ncbi:MAG TPA: hypothetical protein VMT91_02660 [Anaerolineales bacterium]|nr:hypothetical protein [Anaerolineales bacterium]
MKTMLERTALAGLGLLSMTHDKAQKLVDELSERGEVKADEAKGWVDELVQRGKEERRALRKMVRAEVKKTMDEMGLATKEDIQKLAAKNKPQTE